MLLTALRWIFAPPMDGEAMKNKAGAKGKALRTNAPRLQPVEDSFAEVLRLIQSAKQRAYQAVNTELVTLYWQIGEYISRKLASAEWGGWRCG